MLTYLKPYRLSTFIVLFLSTGLPAVAAAAPLNLAPGASVSASSWRIENLVTTTKDDLPRNAADQTTATGWSPDEKADGAQWLRFDFTRPWPMTYRWSRLITRWDTPPASYRWEVSRDGLHWQPLVSRKPSSTVDEVTVRGSGSYLRLVVSEATTNRLLEAEIFSSSGGAGRVNLPQLAFSRNLASVDWSGGSERNVFLYRVTRDASLQVQEGGSASTTSLVAELAATRTQDRVEYPNLTGLPLIFNWTVEAFAPNGDRIGSAQTSEPYDVQIRSPKPFALRGVVEGYYGPVFSRVEREDMVRFIGKHGGNFYLYGPKLDAYHREKWRQPYPDDFVSWFGQLSDLGLQHGVRVAYALSPGLDYSGSPADRDAAIDKLKTLHGAGIRWFGLFMDDIPIAVDVTAANLQVELANDIVAALREIDPKTYLIFVPTVYWGEMDSFSDAQLRYLAALKNLGPDITVMWTGTGVFAPTITHAQVDPIAVLINHPLLIWDNYPVADFFLGRRTHLGPVRGRERTLGTPAGPDRYVSGFLANPMWMAAANRIPLVSVMDYLRDPAAYNPEASLRSALAEEIPPESLGIFQIWTQAFVTNDLVGVTESEATRTVAEARSALITGRQPSPRFLAHAAAYYIAEAKLKTLYHADLAGDLLPLAHKTAALGEAELVAWQMQDKGANERSTALAPFLKRAAGSTWIVNQGLDELYLKAFAQASTVVTQAGPTLKGRIPTRITVGEPLRLRFSVGDATDATIIGLSNAALSPQGILDWTPGHTGVERWVVIASNAAGSSVLYGETHVVEQEARESSGCASGGMPSSATSGWPGSMAGTLLAGWFVSVAMRRFRRVSVEHRN